MTLTVESTFALPFGMMEAVSGLRLHDAVDRYRDYVLFRVNDEHYVIIGPASDLDERAVNRWFGHGWTYRVGDYEDTVIMHIEADPDLIEFRNMVRLPLR